MIRLNQVMLDNESLGKEFVLTAIYNDYKYDENNKASKDENSASYEVAIPAVRMEKMNVKIAEKPKEWDLTGGKMIMVSFENLEAHFYYSKKNENFAISGKADSIKLLNKMSDVQKEKSDGNEK